KIEHFAIPRQREENSRRRRRSLPPPRAPPCPPRPSRKNRPTMATTAAAHALAKGPLSTALGQWAFLGLGTFVIFTGDNGVSRAAQEVAGIAFRLVTGREASLVGLLTKEAALNHSAGLHQPQAPIVIHTSNPSEGGSNARVGGWTMTIVRLGVASGACWTAYIVFAHCLPDQIKAMLPVTRKFFEEAVTSLGRGILRVRDALSEQIENLSTKQDQLSARQDETHGAVLGLRDDIGEVRLNVDDVAAAISRCESSLTDAAGRQTYMSRGVRLLVRCVGDLLRSSDPGVAAELEKFSRIELMDGDDFKDRGSPSRGGAGECPSSPRLSEIGSTTSTARTDDHHHHHMGGHGYGRAMSLPRPRARDSIVTPGSAPGLARHPSLLGSPSPCAGSIRGILGGRADSGISTATTSATTSSSGSSSGDDDASPENEHPRATADVAARYGHLRDADAMLSYINGC
ncbi:hypothetical protein ACHAWF_004809, partial [Thalassiosira exigua]